MADTSTYVANMLGLGPMLAQIQDPAFLAQVQFIVQSIAETRARCERMEAVIARIAAASGVAELGADGAGTLTPTGGAPDNGDGHDQAPAGRVGKLARSAGDGIGVGT